MKPKCNHIFDVTEELESFLEEYGGNNDNKNKFRFDFRYGQFVLQDFNDGGGGDCVSFDSINYCPHCGEKTE